jgi:hypothetical protein
MMWNKIKIGHKQGKGNGKLPLCLSNKAVCHEGVPGSGCVGPHFLDLDTTLRWVVSFMPQPLYFQGKSPPVPIGLEAGWAPESVWTTWRRQNSLPYQDSNSNPLVVQPVASCYTKYTIPTPGHKQEGNNFGTGWLWPSLQYDSSICLGGETTKIDLSLDRR